MRFRAVFEHHAKERVYNVSFPDIPGCLTYGETLVDAQKMAREALTGVLLTMIEMGIAIPKASNPKGKNLHWIEPDKNVAFALWLREQRKKTGMTQTEVAERLGIKYQVYQRLEDPAKANPTLKTIQRIENIFATKLVAV